MALPLLFSSTDLALLPGLLLLETVLSTDNALALASLVRRLATEPEQQRLLNWGMATAIGLRLLAVPAAGVLLRHPLVRVLGGGYLVWLALAHFRGELQAPNTPEREAEPRAGMVASGRRQPSWIARVLLLALTNLAFSLDSICAALALTDHLPLVMLAGTAGVVVLRGVTALMVSWMQRFANLANAGYLTVLVVGLRLMVEQLAPVFAPSESMVIAMMAVLFGWGLRQPQPARP